MKSMMTKHFYLFEGRKFNNMKEVMDFLKISREGFRILRIVDAIERIDYEDEQLKEVRQNGDGNNSKEYKGF